MYIFFYVVFETSFYGDLGIANKICKAFYYTKSHNKMEITTLSKIPAFHTHNTKNINPTGSYFGTIYIDYDYLLHAFGCPQECNKDKSDAEWDIELSDGRILHIYNWKNGINYCGVDGLRKEEISEWSIGTNVIEKEKLLAELSLLFPPQTKFEYWNKVYETVTIELTPTF